MPAHISRLLLLPLSCLLALPAMAVTVTRVDIQGTDDERLIENVRSALSVQ